MGLYFPDACNLANLATRSAFNFAVIRAFISRCWVGKPYFLARLHVFLFRQRRSDPVAIWQRLQHHSVYYGVDRRRRSDVAASAIVASSATALEFRHERQACVRIVPALCTEHQASDQFANSKSIIGHPRL